VGHRDYRQWGVPHFVLELAPDFDPAKERLFFVDKEGAETEVFGVINTTYYASLGGNKQFPEIEILALGNIRIAKEE
jgi:hypothetical protein